MDYPLPAVTMSNASREPYRLSIKSSTGFVTVKSSNDKCTTHAANGERFEIPNAESIAIWPSLQSDASAGEPDAIGAIQSLDCSDSGLLKLDVTGLPSLERLRCGKNGLRHLWLHGPANSSHSGPQDLKHLDCADNEIATLDLSALCNLETVNCSNNHIRTLTLGAGLKSLREIDCSNNRLRTIDLAGLVALQMLNAKDNAMEGPAGT